MLGWTEFHCSCSHSFLPPLHSGLDLSPEFCPYEHVKFLAGYCHWTSDVAHLSSAASHSATLGRSSFLPFSFWHSCLFKLKLLFISPSVTSSTSILQDRTSLLSKWTLPPSLCYCLRSGSHLLPGLLQLTPNWSPLFAVLSKPPLASNRVIF